jgi:hypothetical protein
VYGCRMCRRRRCCTRAKRRLLAPGRELPAFSIRYVALGPARPVAIRTAAFTFLPSIHRLNRTDPGHRLLSAAPTPMPRWWSSDSSNGASSPSVVTCHFCAQSYRLPAAGGNVAAPSSSKRSRLSDLPVLHQGSWSSFLCPACESWNLKDVRTGDFLDDSPLYSNASLNQASSSALPASAGHAASSSSSIFCRDCLTNQNLQVQLLAGYIPADALPQAEGILEARLAGYRASLDDRYPLVCAQCQTKVEDVIEERNWKAKARTVGGWLRKSAKMRTAPRAFSLEPSAAMPGSTPSAARNRIWQAKRAAWMTLYAGTTCSCSVPALFPRSEKTLENGTGPFPSSWPMSFRVLLVAVFGITSLFVSFWDPTYIERQSRGSEARIVGRKRWLVSTCTKSGISCTFTLTQDHNVRQHKAYYISCESVWSLPLHFLAMRLLRE